MRQTVCPRSEALSAAASPPGPRSRHQNVASELARLRRDFYRAQEGRRIAVGAHRINVHELDRLRVNGKKRQYEIEES